MYDRAYRYLLGMKHRPDDLPYPSGPTVTSKEPIKKSPTMLDYKLEGRENKISDMDTMNSYSIISIQTVNVRSRVATRDMYWQVSTIM